MKRLMIGLVAVLALTLCAEQASAQFFRFGFGGFFRPRNNIQINNFNGGGFGNQRVFVNNGFRSGFGGNRVVVNNGFSGGFVNRGFRNNVVVNNGYGFGGNRVFVNGGYGGFVQRQVFVQSYVQPLYAQQSFVQPFAVDYGCAGINAYGGCGVGVSSFGYGGFAVRSRCY